MLRKSSNYGLYKKHALNFPSVALCLAQQFFTI